MKPCGLCSVSRDWKGAWFARHPAGPTVKQLFQELLLAGLTRLKVEPLPAMPENLQEVVTMLTARIDAQSLEAVFVDRE
ncbi:MAG: hypothetical protein HQM03_14440 [Magnetococcales bacterium]|nr:hypothetical protein [Magnetococcales bacterium]